MPPTAAEKFFFLRFDEIVPIQDPLIISKLIEEHACGESFMVRETVDGDDNPHYHVFLATRTSEKKLRLQVQSHWTGNKEYSFKQSDGNSSRVYQYMSKGTRDDPPVIKLYDGTAWSEPKDRTASAHAAFWEEYDQRPKKRERPEDNLSKILYSVCKRQKVSGTNRQVITEKLIEIYKGVWKPVQIHQMIGIVNLVSLMLDEDGGTVKRDIVRQVVDRL